MDYDVRCFLVPHATGISPIYTGLPGSVTELGALLAQIGAAWADVSDVLLSHDHPDHVGGLAEVVALAPQAAVWGNAPLSARTFVDGATINGLRVIATPGHTAGHVRFLHDDGTLLAGDLIGSHDGRLVRAPAAFTADAAQAELSIHTIAGIGASRVLFAHGAEIDHSQQALLGLLDTSPDAERAPANG